MHALVVGGTGPTGPHIVRGLVERGFDVAMFHRGTHESPLVPSVEHIHGDPHFAETIAGSLADRRFDVVVATYGRVALLAKELAGRCDRFVAIGGVPVYAGYWEDEAAQPSGMRILADEDSPTVDHVADSPTRAARMAYLIRSVETTLREFHEAGAFSWTHVRYPIVYGEGKLGSGVWGVVRRVLDGRSRMIISDGGLSIFSRQAAENAAHTVLLAVDRPREAAGQVFNSADDVQYTMRQWDELILRAMGASLEFVSLPDRICGPARASFPGYRNSGHGIVSTAKAQRLLGYSDIVDPRNVVERLVHWTVEHQHELRREHSVSMTDPFDYEREDLLIEAYERALVALETAVPFRVGVVFHHPYPHPKEANRTRDELER